jgi:hypothetical protein
MLRSGGVMEIESLAFKAMVACKNDARSIAP